MFSDTTIVTQPDSTLGCNSVRLSWSRTTPAATTEDRAMCTIHIAKVVGGGLFSPLLLAELPAIETALDAMWTTLKAVTQSGWTLTEYRWFEHRASHGSYSDGSEVVGPPIRITAKSVAGTGVGLRLPDQDGATVTFRTASRKHWGRIYLPGFDGTGLGTFGRLSNAYVDTIAGALHTFQAALTGNAQTIVVWSYRKLAVLDMSEIRADDVVDIQRRRRAKNVAYFRSYTS